MEREERDRMDNKPKERRKNIKGKQDEYGQKLKAKMRKMMIKDLRETK